GSSAFTSLTPFGYATDSITRYSIVIASRRDRLRSCERSRLPLQISCGRPQQPELWHIVIRVGPIDAGHTSPCSPRAILIWLCARQRRTPCVRRFAAPAQPERTRGR